MFRRVLVPVDLTPKNRGVLGVAAGLTAGDGTLTVLHVIETLDVPFEELAEFYQRLEEKAWDGMADLIDDADLPVAVERRVTYGPRAQQVVTFAERLEADLIVLSSHRVEPTNPLENWATVSYRIAIMARCPVLLVK